MGALEPNETKKVGLTYLQHLNAIVVVISAKDVIKAMLPAVALNLHGRLECVLVRTEYQWHLVARA